MPIAEGSFNAMRVWQAGFRNVVALMGTSLSDEQEQLLIKALVSNGKLTLMLDPDEPGIKATKEILERLITMLYTKVIDLTDDGVEPDDLSAERIREMFGEFG